MKNIILSLQQLYHILLVDLVGLMLMGAGRTLYGVWGHKINLKKALLASGILCVACYAVTVFVQIPIVSLLGCALCGLSVSLMWPGTFSLSAASHPMGGTAMFGILAIFGDIGGAVGPWLVGLFSDLSQKSARLVALGASYGLSVEQVGLKTGLLIAMVFPVALVIGILCLTRKGRRNKPEVKACI